MAMRPAEGSAFEPVPKWLLASILISVLTLVTASAQAIIIFDENSGKAPPVTKRVNRQMLEVALRPLNEAEKDWWELETTP